MKEQYRIVKVTTTYRDGRIEVSHAVEQKMFFLFFWVTVRENISLDQARDTVSGLTRKIHKEEIERT